MLVLERAANLIRGLTARLVHIAPDALTAARDGRPVVPGIVGMVEPTSGRGNFEAMAVAPVAEPGCPAEIDVFIASDDNNVRLLPRTLAHYRVAARPEE